ncbi:MAG: methyl-accepting chemotaxis protein [Gammaproteobacteria bacterium]|nr:methyl-accepting chemotaxis protein [Gammaproteobacteria bacterium]
MTTISQGAQEISASATQMDIAIKDSQQGSEAIAAAAEEQSAACEQVLKSLDEQNQALSGAEQASQELEMQSEELKNSTDITKSAEEVAAAAEELSTSIEEISRSSSEIMTAVTEIARGSEQAAAAAEQSAAGMAQIETGITLAESKANEAVERTLALKELLVTNQKTTETVIENLSASAENGKALLTDIQEIEGTSRSIAKIIDAIATVSIKTSMLAVNGAIEAARAGEFGKGFAVVSEDIQSLADDTAENIEQIKELIKGIQDQSLDVMNDLQTISNTIIDDVNNAERSSKRL